VGLGVGGAVIFRHYSRLQCRYLWWVLCWIWETRGAIINRIIWVSCYIDTAKIMSIRRKVVTSTINVHNFQLFGLEAVFVSLVLLWSSISVVSSPPCDGVVPRAVSTTSTGFDYISPSCCFWAERDSSCECFAYGAGGIRSVLCHISMFFGDRRTCLMADCRLRRPAGPFKVWSRKEIMRTPVSSMPTCTYLGHPAFCRKFLTVNDIYITTAEAEKFWR
jgi:hypothetical protein